MILVPKINRKNKYFAIMTNLQTLGGSDALWYFTIQQVIKKIPRYFHQLTHEEVTSDWFFLVLKVYIHQGSACDGMGRKKSSHGINIFWLFHPMGRLSEIFRPMGWDRIVPSHAERWYAWWSINNIPATVSITWANFSVIDRT